MARPPIEDRSHLKNVVMSFKLTEAERVLIDRLVVARTEEIKKLTGQRLNLTAGSYLRWLVLRDAEARGMMPDDAASEPPPSEESAALADAGPARKKPAKAAQGGPKRR
jgi:hypothetical protein